MVCAYFKEIIPKMPFSFIRKTPSVILMVLIGLCMHFDSFACFSIPYKLKTFISQSEWFVSNEFVYNWYTKPFILYKLVV
ncbi:hypothetical protein [Bacillus cereus]|uniref:hypothetical protein n=1 Tax=Bacillus cereus TaxID=1396 RepID=UPI001145703C|nr:hypothetical protein [Bacillus cereus]